MTDLETLWRHHVVAPWYLRPSQLDLYELVVAQKNPFLECARRFGKTTTILAYVIERLMENPGWVCTWCEPWKTQAREIVMPELEKMTANMPEDLKPRWISTDSYYLFPNGSRLKLRGVNEDRGKSARGSFAHIIVADEFGFWIDANNVVNGALRPQLLTTDGQFIFASTPSENLDHPYYSHKADAIRDGRFIQKIIHDNESLTHEQIEQAAREVGGTESTTWKREYLCEAISDPERLVIPEYNPGIHDLPDDAPRPPHFLPYVGMDLGFNDSTFAVFGYVDFLQATLVIEDELCVSGKNSKQITDAAKEIEARLWPSLRNGVRIERWSDNDLQQIADMWALCNYELSPTDKHDKKTAINALRLRFTHSKIKIKERCKNLRYQLKVGLWKESRNDFERGAGVGHLDGVMALVYLNRNVNESRNPYPLVPDGFSSETHFISPDLSQSEEQKALAALTSFGRSRKHG